MNVTNDFFWNFTTNSTFTTSSTNSTIPVFTTTQTESPLDYPILFHEICFDWYFVCIPSCLSSIFFASVYILWNRLENRIKLDQLFIKVFKSKAFGKKRKNKRHSKSKRKNQGQDDDYFQYNAEIELSEFILESSSKSHLHSMSKNSKDWRNSVIHRSKNNLIDSIMASEKNDKRDHNNNNSIRNNQQKHAHHHNGHITHGHHERNSSRKLSGEFDLESSSHNNNVMNMEQRTDAKSLQTLRSHSHHSNQSFTRLEMLFINDFLENNEILTFINHFHNELHPLFTNHFEYYNDDIYEIISIIISYLPELQVLYYGYMIEYSKNNNSLKYSIKLTYFTLIFIILLFIFKILQIILLFLNWNIINVTMLVIWPEWKISHQSWIVFYSMQCEDSIAIKYNRRMIYKHKRQMIQQEISNINSQITHLQIGSHSATETETDAENMTSHTENRLFKNEILSRVYSFLTLLIYNQKISSRFTLFLNIFQVVCVLCLVGPLLALFIELLVVTTFSGTLTAFGIGILLLILTCSGCCLSTMCVTCLFRMVFDDDNDSSLSSFKENGIKSQNNNGNVSIFKQIVRLSAVFIVSDVIIYAFVSNIVFQVYYFAINRNKLVEDEDASDEWIVGAAKAIGYSFSGQYCSNQWYQPFFSLAYDISVDRIDAQSAMLVSMWWL